MKKKSRIFASIISGIMVLSAVACTEKAEVIYDVWGTDNLVSVVQETTYNNNYEKQTANLTFSMAKNEQEYDQIIVTAGSNISSIELVASELTCGDNKIPKENIEIFMQKYIQCNDQTKYEGVMGIKDHMAYNNAYYPDMLMYMDKAVEYKENVVKINENQGFTVRVKTDADTISGTYTGTFKLNVCDETTDIPVTVEVWDFALGKATGKTQVTPQTLYYMNGEFDNTIEMERTYYELCLEYDICLKDFPGHTSFRYNTDVASYIDEIKRYWDHPNFTAYGLPDYETGSWGVINSWDKETIKTYILEVAKASTPIDNYLSKMVIMHRSLDEPQLNDTYAMVGNYYATFKQIKQAVVAELESSGWFATQTSEFASEIENIVLNIPEIITSPYTEGITYNGEAYSSSNINAWCPMVNEFSTQVERDLLKWAAEESNGEQWFYVCNQPQYPYPAHFTQAQPIGNRILRWIQYDLDVVGYMNWAVSFYNKNYLRDPYEDPRTIEMNPAGEGYFFFPGKAYNSKPFPTARLLAFSDGQEDMDMLYMLEDLYLSTATSYGISASEAQKAYDKMMSIIMDRVIDGSTNTFVYQDLLSIREDLAKMIQTLLKGELVSYEIEGTDANYTIYTKSETINVNGEQKVGVLANDGYVIKGSISLKTQNTLSVVTDLTNIEVFVSKTRHEVVFNKNYISVSKEATVSVADSEISFNLATKEDISFLPFVKIKLTQFGLSKFTEMDNLVFYYTNNSKEDYVLKVLLSKNTNTMELEEYNVKAGETLLISLPLVYNNQDGVNYERVIGYTDTLMLSVVSNSGKHIEGKIYNMNFTKQEG